jgi:hypothetical protein
LDVYRGFGISEIRLNDRKHLNNAKDRHKNC